MIEVRLNQTEWAYDPSRPLGRAGGFGAVFEGQDTAGNPVAVKRLHLSASKAAHRELALANDLGARAFEHVIHVMDSGQDANSGEYFVVMPRAERALQDHLDNVGSMEQSEAIATLYSIASGLEEVGHIVHRDLKPGNILWHEGHWKISDFGIARFVEDSTSTETLKDCLSPHYAAPEQWRLETATGATDIYALGCIGHALLTGQPPFVGSVDEIRNGHLHGSPPVIPSATAQLRSVLTMMLRKSPQARPNISRVKATLAQIAADQGERPSAVVLGRLAAAAADHDRSEAEAEAKKEQARSEAAHRALLLEDASASLLDIARELEARVSESVPSARIIKSGGTMLIQVGDGKLGIELEVSRVGKDDFQRSGWHVIGRSSIGVDQASPRHSRSASLWFTCRSNPGDDYRWYEVGYMGNPLANHGFQFQPTAVKTELADRAHSNAMDIVQQSYQPIAIDGEEVDAFCDRWLGILVAACEGRLQHLGGGLPDLR